MQSVMMHIYEATRFSTQGEALPSQLGQEAGQLFTYVVHPTYIAAPPPPLHGEVARAA